MGDTTELKCLVPLRPEGDLPPLVLAHPAGGDVETYRALLPYLDPRQPVYAFQALAMTPGYRTT